MKCEPLEPGKIQASLELVKATIADCAGTLPGGIVGDGSVLTFAHRRANMGLKRELGEVRTKPELKGRWGRQVAEFVSVGLEQLGEVRRDKPGAMSAEVARLCVGDVLYLLLCGRIVAAGGRLNLADTVCQACGEELTGIGVEVADLELWRWPRAGEDGGPVTAGNPPVARVGLFDGVPVAEGKVAHTVMVRAPVWADSLYRLTSSQADNSVNVSIAMAQGAICGCELEGVPLTNGVRLTSAQMDEISDRDANLIEEALNLITPSPIYAAEIDCPKCGAPHTARFNWRDPSFFGSSPGK